MKITLKGTNIELSDSIYAYVNEKIGGLEKFVKNFADGGEGGKPPTECWVEVEKTTRHHQSGDIFRAEAQMKLPGIHLRAESRQADLHQAIDAVKDELRRQIKSFKDKMLVRRRAKP